MNLERLQVWHDTHMESAICMICCFSLESYNPICWKLEPNHLFPCHTDARHRVEYVAASRLNLGTGTYFHKIWKACEGACLETARDKNVLHFKASLH